MASDETDSNNGGASRIGDESDRHVSVESDDFIDAILADVESRLAVTHSTADHGPEDDFDVEAELGLSTRADAQPDTAEDRFLSEIGQLSVADSSTDVEDEIDSDEVDSGEVDSGEIDSGEVGTGQVDTGQVDTGDASVGVGTGVAERLLVDAVDAVSGEVEAVDASSGPSLDAAEERFLGEADAAAGTQVSGEVEAVDAGVEEERFLAEIDAAVHAGPAIETAPDTEDTDGLVEPDDGEAPRTHLDGDPAFLEEIDEELFGEALGLDPAELDAEEAVLVDPSIPDGETLDRHEAPHEVDATDLDDGPAQIDAESLISTKPSERSRRDEPETLKDSLALMWNRQPLLMIAAGALVIAGLIAVAAGLIANL